MWQPITLEALYDKLLAAEEAMSGEIWRLWQLVRIFPEKWQQLPYGEEGGGFYAVAVCGKQVIWYNDIEEGFNLSAYERYGEIKEYWCNQDELRHSVQHLLCSTRLS